jgi:hypothetical protein
MSENLDEAYHIPVFSDFTKLWREIQLCNFVTLESLSTT